MKIEVGKSYKNREGNKATVLYQFTCGRFAVVVDTGDHRDQLYYVDQEGRCYNTHSDLISEWVEPKTYYVNVYAAGIILPALHKARAHADRHAAENRIACVKLTEGQYDD